MLQLMEDAQDKAQNNIYMIHTQKKKIIYFLTGLQT